MIIYCDGACSGNPGRGGWAFVCFNDRDEEIFHDGGGEEATTNNRMELVAALMACEYASFRGLYKGAGKKSDIISCSKVEIWTDSQYVQKGMSEWMPKWKANGWRASKGSVKNKELWQRLDAVNAYLQPSWNWVKGHSGDVKNDRADEIARSYVSTVKSTSTQAVKKQQDKDKEKKIYLDVPYAEKDEAKKCGARWDPGMKKWYVAKLSDGVKKWYNKPTD